MAISKIIQAQRRRDDLRANNKPKYKRILLKARLVRRNLTKEEFDRLLKKQDRLCAVCKRPLLMSILGGCDLDHNHKTNKNRGLLCRRCNLMIGYIEENLDRIDLLDSMKKYLEFYQ